uniref:Uncharacterized protein n=1 Tax=Nothoprocta perdicaria TaxID=30464 RepID=A0A8C6Z5Y0_NOTPE
LPCARADMAASSRRRFVGGFVCGAAAGAAASCWAAWRLLRSQSRPEPEPPQGKSGGAAGRPWRGRVQTGPLLRCGQLAIPILLSMKTTSGAAGREDTWHQQETTSFQQEPWLKHFIFLTLCLRIMKIMLDFGTGE